MASAREIAAELRLCSAFDALDVFMADMAEQGRGKDAYAQIARCIYDEIAEVRGPVLALIERLAVKQAEREAADAQLDEVA